MMLTGIECTMVVFYVRGLRFNGFLRLINHSHLMLTECTVHCLIMTDRIKYLYLQFWYYSRIPLIRPPSESHWCGRIRGMVAREGFVYKQNAQSVTRNVVV